MKIKVERYYRQDGYFTSWKVIFFDDISVLIERKGDMLCRGVIDRDNFEREYSQVEFDEELES